MKKIITWLTIIIIALTLAITMLYYPRAVPMALAMLLVCCAAIVIKEVK